MTCMSERGTATAWGDRLLWSAPVRVGPNSIWPGGLGRQAVWERRLLLSAHAAQCRCRSCRRACADAAAADAPDAAAAVQMQMPHCRCRCRPVQIAPQCGRLLNGRSSSNCIKQLMSPTACLLLSFVGLRSAPAVPRAVSRDEPLPRIAPGGAAHKNTKLNRHTADSRALKPEA
jgi:hypothetical protein